MIYDSQTYVGSFEVQVEGLTGPQAKSRMLCFEVQGEGNLPRVAITKPALKNKKGVPLLLFSRILLGRSQTLPLCLKNDGTLPSKVCFFPSQGSVCSYGGGPHRTFMTILRESQ